MNADDAGGLWRDGGSRWQFGSGHRRSSAFIGGKNLLFASAAWRGRSALHATCRRRSAFAARACSDSTHAAGHCVLATAPGMQARRLSRASSRKGGESENPCKDPMQRDTVGHRVPARLAGGPRGAKPGRPQPGRGKGGKSEIPCKDPIERATVCGGVSGAGIVGGRVFQTPIYLANGCPCRGLCLVLVWRARRRRMRETPLQSHAT